MSVTLSECQILNRVSNFEQRFLRDEKVSAKALETSMQPLSENAKSGRILGNSENSPIYIFFHIGGILGAPRPRYSYAASATGTALFTASMNTGDSTLMHEGWDGTEVP